ncbi:hypothetical protein [Natrialba swarupiae]|uniref:DUF8130 domain-containing protein n=1 Tax=Natrialba swarupiae TaxID=2448032 RepID=A0A5D5AQ20_9EURY|nr:hypothetical protein [Natrialba swarupiae]TYT61171.1 hypothetical protein FYC77_14720 [Natrialba swarupiae]
MTAGSSGPGEDRDDAAERGGAEDRADGRPPRSTLRRRTVLGAVAASTTALAGCMADTEYAIVRASSEPVENGPISFDLEVVDPEIRVDSPGVIELTVQNVDDGPIELVSMGIRPFGTLELRAEPEDHPGETWIYLWSDEYEESPHVDVRPNGMGLDGEELVMTLFPDESFSVRYEVPGDEVVRDGTYELSGRLGDDHVLRYRRPDEENGEETTDDGGSANEGEGSALEDETGDDEGGASEEEEGDENGDDEGDGSEDDEYDDGSRLDGTGLTPSTEIEIEAESWIPFR